MAVELESKASLSSSFQSQGSSFFSEPSAPHSSMLPDPASYDPLSLPGTAGVTLRLFCQQSHSDRPTHNRGQANHISHKRPMSLATLFLESRSWVLFISGQLPSLVLPVKVKNKHHTHTHTHKETKQQKTQCLFMHVMR